MLFSVKYFPKWLDKLLILRYSVFLYSIQIFNSVAQSAEVVGEVLYVRPNGGTYGLEDGSDWENAFDGMPAFNSGLWGTGPGQIGPATTVYVAGGTYNTKWRPGIGGTGESTRIIIKRATATEHGTELGWQASFDSQVLLNNQKISFKTRW